MSQRIIYYYAVASGFAYLGESELRRIAALAGAVVDYRPVDIQKVFAASGTTPPPRQPEARRSYRTVELSRWAKRRSLPIKTAPAFWPVEVGPASLAIIAAQEMGINPGPLSFAFLRAVWAEDRNIADPETVASIVAASVPSGSVAELMERADDDGTKLIYERISDEAIAAGVFGSPTVFVGGEMFFGQDRLDIVAEKLGVTA
jgi:2-hydroxychromene-2-carboxylate isomerase